MIRQALANVAGLSESERLALLRVILDLMS